MSAAAIDVMSARIAQRQWSAGGIRARLKVLRALRHDMAAEAQMLAASVPRSRSGSLHRSRADTLVAEVLPLIEACRFLEREASFILRPRRESTGARPFWLTGVTVDTLREPLGVVLIIGPSNYPLFLPGAQALQALAAGNAVLWKPAPGGEAPAHALRLMLLASGLDPALLSVLDTAPASAQSALAAGVDKVFLTGSAITGRAVMHHLAETLTPAVMELSGCDAVFVLESAEISRAVDALAFGLRFNGSATCMAPRRVFVAAPVADRFTALLAAALSGIAAVPVPPSTRVLVRDLVDEATLYGASIVLDGFAESFAGGSADSGLRPTLLAHATPDMRVTQTDVFAPILSLLPFSSIDDAVASYDVCPYALTAAIFGEPREARALAGRLLAGTVLINDLIVATCDPRASFGGRAQSGFGSTRGREGLLEMTAVKTVVHQRAKSRVPYQPTTPVHRELFAAYIQAVHGSSWRRRWQGLRRLFDTARGMKL